MGNTWRIHLENIGRDKVTRSVDVDEKHTLPEVEQIAIHECSKHLLSREIGLTDKCDLTYTVFAGMRSVGKVSIVSV